MARWGASLTLWLCGLLVVAFAQTPASDKIAPKETTVAGLKVRAVPELLYEHLPQLQRGQGVVVEQVTANSPASLAGLKRHDLVTQFNGAIVKDADQFKRLIADAPNLEKVPFVLVRAGKEMRLQVMLHLPEPAEYSMKGFVKPGGPPAVTVEAEPQDDGTHKVTFRYYSNGNGKLESLTCKGTITDIEQQVKTLSRANQMPPSVQDLAEVALKRLRDLNK